FTDKRISNVESLPSSLFASTRHAYLCKLRHNVKPQPDTATLPGSRAVMRCRLDTAGVRWRRWAFHRVSIQLCRPLCAHNGPRDYPTGGFGGQESLSIPPALLMAICSRHWRQSECARKM